MQKTTNGFQDRRIRPVAKVMDAMLVAAMLMTSVPALADEPMFSDPPAMSDEAQQTPPEMPEGVLPPEPGSQPASGPRPESGTPPEPPAGGAPMGQPPEKPDGMLGIPDGPGGPGGPGGMAQRPKSYAAVKTLDADATLTEAEIISEGQDENALHVSAGSVVLKGATISRESADSTGGDAASFYGVGAAVLVTGGSAEIDDAVIVTECAGGAGVFALGEGVATVKNSLIATTGDTSGGIHVAGGGTLRAENLTVTTEGASSAAIRSDRGGGTMTVEGGSYTSHGTGSPAVYVTADIAIRNAELTATGSEALCLEGKNTVTLENCVLSGDMPDLEQNDNTWTVILYQSMSGDSEIGEGSFTMRGGRLLSGNGGLLYTTNTKSVFTLENVEIEAADDCEYFLRCTGNRNARIWGREGENGADCTLNAAAQQLPGDIVWDSASTLTMSLTDGSVLTGAIVQDNACAGSATRGRCTLDLDASSRWIVTGNSFLTSLAGAGQVVDEEGKTVTIQTEEGEILVQGDSHFVVTVEEKTGDTANV